MAVASLLPCSNPPSSAEKIEHRNSLPTVVAQQPAPPLRRSAPAIFVVALIFIAMLATAACDSWAANSRIFQTSARRHAAAGASATAACPPRIAIVVLAKPNQDANSDLAKTAENLLWASVANKRAYADHHNYGLYVVPAPLQTLRTRAVWDKLAAMQAVFAAHPEHEWVWMLDLDTFVVNLDRHVEDVVALAEHQQRAHNRTVDLMIARDCNGINAGSMLLRRSAWTARLLERWWSDEWRTVANFEMWQENAVLVHMHNTDADVREHTLVVPMRAFNAYVSETQCGDGYQVACVLFVCAV
jgi:hypothetical protein